MRCVGESRQEEGLVMRFVCVGVLFVAGVQAQMYGHFDRGIPPAYPGSLVAAKDLDGDGEVDLLYRGHGNSLTPAGLYLSRGGGSFGPYRQVSPELGEIVAPGDFDGDGDTDLFLSKRGRCEVWFNDGKANFTLAGPSFSYAVSGAVAGDYDGDGFDDLLLGSGQLAFSRGNGAFYLRGQGAMTKTGDPGAVDIDGDGDLDAVLDGSVFLNDGTGVLGTTPVPGTAGTYMSIDFADFDGDGDLDLVRCDGTTTELCLQSAGMFSVSSGSGLGGLASELVLAIDSDSDGNIDVFCFGGVKDPFAKHMRNDGLRSFSVRGQHAIGRQTAAGQPIDSGLVVDVNGSGRDDLLLAQSRGLPVVHLNDGGAFHPWGDSSYMSLLGAGDLNGDGHVDLVSMGGPTVAFANGDGTWKDPVLLASASFGAMFLAYMGDLDGDGDTDMIMDMNILINDGTGLFTRGGPSFLFAVVGAYAFGDVNGDGNIDLLNKKVSPSVILLGNGAGVFMPAQPGYWPPLLASPGALAQGLADMNGDGHLDALFGMPGRIVICANDGGGRYGRIFASVPASGDLMDVADVDGDGDQDFFCVDTNGKLSLFVNQGQGQFADVSASHVAGLPAVPGWMRSGQLADADGDGDIDVFMFEGFSGSRVMVGYNDGSGRYTHVEWIIGNWSSSPIAPVLSDVDRDGDVDILPWSGIRVMKSLGRHLHFDGVHQGIAKLKVFSSSDTSMARSVWPLVSTSVLPTPVKVPGLGVLGIDPQTALLLPPTLIPTGKSSTAIEIAVPTAVLASGTRLVVQAAIQGPGGWGLTNTEGMLLVY